MRCDAAFARRMQRRRARCSSTSNVVTYTGVVLKIDPIPNFLPAETAVQIPGYPNFLAQVSTSTFKAAISVSPSSPTSKSFNFLPWLSWILMAILQHLSSNSPILLLSASLHPRVVIAGIPMRTPPGDKAEASPWTAFLFRVIDTASHTFSSFEPVRLCGRKSHNSKWLSVPLVANLCPLDIKTSPNTLVLSTICWEYALNSGVLTSNNCVAKAPI